MAYRKKKFVKNDKTNKMQFGLIKKHSGFKWKLGYINIRDVK